MNAPITQETQLQDLYDYALELKNSKADFKGNPSDFHFNDEGLMVSGNPKNVLSAMLPLKPNERAITHLCWKLGAAYDLNSLDKQYFLALQDKAPDLLAANLNHAIERMPVTKGWTVRAYEQTARAVLSDEYLIIDNDTMLQTLNDVLVEDGTEHRISNRSFVNVDNMCVDIRFKDVVTPKADRGGNTKWGLGIRIRNGEVGDWSGGVYPALWRSGCDNSFALDDRTHSFVFKHFGQRTLASKKVMLKAAMAEILPFAATMLETMIEADGRELPKFGDVVNGLGLKHGWSEEFTQAVFSGSERNESVAGLLNGITWAAHKVAKQEATVDAEFLAGRLLFDNGSSFNEAISLWNAREQREEAKAARAAARDEARSRRSR